MTDEQLAAIRERCEAATEGPWEKLTEQVAGMWRETRVVHADFDICADVCIGDAEFIAAARTDVPALLDEVERLRMDLGLFRSENDDLRVENERLRKVCQQFFALFPPGSPDAKARGCICQPLDREQNLPAYMHTRYHNCPLHGSMPQKDGDA